MVKGADNTICDTCALISRRYETIEDLAHTAVISRNSVKLAENTICDSCPLNSLRY